MVFRQKRFGKSWFRLLTDWYDNGLAGQFWQMESALKFIQGFLSTCLLFEWENDRLKQAL